MILLKAAPDNRSNLPNMPAERPTDIGLRRSDMTMHDITTFGQQQTAMPAFWRDYEAFPFGVRREMRRLFDDLFRAPFFG